MQKGTQKATQEKERKDSAGSDDTASMIKPYNFPPGNYKEGELAHPQAWPKMFS